MSCFWETAEYLPAGSRYMTWHVGDSHRQPANWHAVNPYASVITTLCGIAVKSWHRPFFRKSARKICPKCARIEKRLPRTALLALVEECDGVDK